MISEDIEARATFLSTLEWLMAVTSRYPSFLEFGLLHLEFGHKNELGEAYGAQDAVRQLAELTHGLKKAFRKTDLVARNGFDFWIIVPFTPASERIHDKILGILDCVEYDGLRVVDRGGSVYLLSRVLQELDKSLIEGTALDLLDYLKQNAKAYSTSIFELPSDKSGFGRLETI